MALHRSWSVLGAAALVAVIAGLMLLSAKLSSAQVQDGATMTVLRGQVAVVHSDGSAIQPAPSGTVVAPGDEIRTLGSTSALITFFAGTELELEQNTIIGIDQVSKQGDRIDISLRQAFGTTINRVQTIAGTGSTYRIDAGGAVALVRGTTFVVIGPITTSAGNVVIIVCGDDCTAASTFAGCPLGPFIGYGVLVANGRVETSCIPFAVARNVDLTSAAFEAVTTIEQQVQGDTRGIPPGQVQSGQQQEIATQDRKREREQDEDDPPQVAGVVVPHVSITDVIVPEGTAATFTVSLSEATSVPVTVTYVTTNGTAIAPGDYTAASNTLTFPPGTTTQLISIPTVADLVVEPPENFALNLTGVANATVADSQGVGTIVEPSTLSLTINNVVGNEGGNAVFTVTLSAASSQQVTVNFATADGSAVAPGDYTAASGTLTFPPGTTTQTITIPLLNDTAAPAAVGAAAVGPSAVEPPETFVVNLSGASGAAIGDAQGQGTILDPVTLTASINDASATEGGNLTFTVSLSAASSQQVTVNFASVNGTGATGAVAPGDFGAVSGTLTFPPNTTSQTIVVTSVDDPIDEADNEVFGINLTGSTVATIADPQGIGTIADNDGPPTISINDVSANPEGTGTNSTASFTVSLSGASGLPITVNYATVDGIATGGAFGNSSCTAGIDYISQSSTVTFNPGVTTQPITITVCGDNLDELDEAFAVNLSTPTNASIVDNQGVATIVDDDTTSVSFVMDVSTTEGNLCSETTIGGPLIAPPCGTKNFTFLVRLSGPSDRAITVDFTTLPGGSGNNADEGLPGSCDTTSSISAADGGVDYEDTTGQLAFPPLSTADLPINVPVCGDQALLRDGTIEGDQTFLVNLSLPTGGAVIGDGQAVGTIQNDDDAPDF